MYFLPYKILLEKHQLHHQHPASAKDPDFCEDGSKNPLLWYLSFMKGYLEGKQSLVVFICMSLVFYPLLLGLHIPLVNLILFWLLPIFLSSIQLFCFGIFLPHRQPKDGYTNRHRAKSSNFSVLLSFLSCYHSDITGNITNILIFLGINCLLLLKILLGVFKKVLNLSIGCVSVANSITNL